MRGLKICILPVMQLCNLIPEDMEICLEDFKRCCRCCLVRMDTMQPLFGASLNDMLIKLTNLQIMQNDGYPQHMCSRCVLKLSSAYTFYTTVLKSHKTLGEVLKRCRDNGELSLANGCEQNELDTFEKGNGVTDNVTSDQEFNSLLEKNTPTQTLPKRTIPNILVSESSEGFSVKEEDNHCSQCEHTSNDQKEFQIHLQPHVAGSRNNSRRVDTCPQLCNICGAQFRWRTSLHRHLRQHRSVQHKCEVCQKAFAEASTLNIHMVRHSNNQKPFDCSTCGRSYTQQSSMRKHAKTHYRRAQLQCKECGKTFLHKQSFLRHCENVHLFSECPVCRKIYKGKKFLNTHMQLHKKDIPNIDGTTHNMATDSINIQTVTVEFLCLICTQKFHTREGLEEHICTGENIT